MANVVDRVGLRLPYLYWSTRQGMLLLTFISLGIWFITGFNIAEGSVPIIGIQWSTFATFSFFFYLMMANFQIGGFGRLSQFKEEFTYDLKQIPMLIHPFRARTSYKQGNGLDAVRASIITSLICIGALFIFESIWVPLYDYFQFGSLTWPVYFAERTSSLLTVGVFRRNMLLAISMPMLAMLIIPITNITQQIRTSFRFNRHWVAIGLLAGLSWIFWIGFPHQSIIPSQIMGAQAFTYSPSNCYVMPNQGLFPQNTYTFYSCSIYDKSYQLKQILGFFDPNPWTHAINVITKFLTFLAISFPFLMKVRITQ